MEFDPLKGFYDAKGKLHIFTEMPDGQVVSTYFSMQEMALMLRKDKTSVDKNGFIIREIANEKPKPPTIIKGYWDDRYRKWAERWIQVTGLLKQEIKRRKIKLKLYREAWDDPEGFLERHPEYRKNETAIPHKAQDIIDVSVAF